VTFALGVVLFALGIGISVALHEAGHMWSARAFGMKVRRYFIGMGPTIWSFRRGETEYGLKWLPIGGFCDIAGMTALDPVTVAEAPRAFNRQKTWKRVVVLCAGSTMHFLIGIVVLYVMAVGGLLQPTPSHPAPAVVGDISCVPPSQDPKTGQATPCAPNAVPPAQRAGLQHGDRILAVAGVPTANFAAVSNEVRKHIGPTPVTIERDGRRMDLSVDIAPVQRLPDGAVPGRPDNKLVTVGAIGVGADLSYGPLAAVPATFDFTGMMFSGTWQGLMMFPEKVPAVLDAIAGKQDPNRPVSVVGVSIIGGDAVDRGQWALFLYLIAVFNFFIGVFNLLPLLPLDGGHVAVNLYERVRDTVRKRMGKAALPPVDYTRLMPITYVFILVIGGISLLTITADIINPIRLPQ
jgi:membrane-associated protease RseP (regulator of RpoE activity)